MWWHSASPRRQGPGDSGRRSIVVQSAALCGLGLLNACGFRPLYANRSRSEEGVTRELAEVRVLPIGHRVGQQLHNLLRDRLNPKGQPSAPRFSLAVKLRERRRDLGIQEDATATRTNLTLVADYGLFAADGKTLLFQGAARSNNAFDVLDDPYATDAAEKDAREKALIALSDEIKVRLAVWFRKQD